MITACQILNIIIALGLACAILAALRGRGIGRQCPPPADPYFHPFGDMPGFTREQLETIARRPVELHHHSVGPATPADRAGGGIAFLSDVAVGSPCRRLRHAR
jgi:hypothetical protein